MASVEIYASWAKYRPKAARWDGPYNGSVMAGNNASGGVYRTLWYFPTGSLSYDNINSITFYVTRRDSYSSKTLKVYVASSYNSDGSANVAATIGTVTLESGGGWQAITVPSSAFDALKRYGYIYMHNDTTNNTYVELSPTASVVIDYTDSVAPNPPTWLSVSPTAVEPNRVTTVTVSWGGASTSLGSITGYNVDWNPGGQGWNRGVSNHTSTTWQDSWGDWPRGMQIGYRVQAINSFGRVSGTIENWDAAINGGPPEPGTLKYNGVRPHGSYYSASPVTLSWDAVTSGSGLDRYEVRMGVWNGSKYVFDTPISAGKALSYTWDLTVYPRGARLDPQVRAVDSLGAVSSWAAIPDANVRYNQLPAAPVVAYPVAGSTVYAYNPYICMTLGAESDGQAQSAVCTIKGISTDSSGDAYSRTGSFAAGSNLVLRWPHAVEGSITATLRGNDGVEDGATATRAFRVLAPTWTDPVLTPGKTPVKAIHVLELRSKINDMRAAYGLERVTWTDTLSAGGGPVKAAHIAELRTAMEQIRDQVNSFDKSNVNNKLPAYTWTAGLERNKLIKAAHIAELRAAVEMGSDGSPLVYGARWAEGSSASAGERVGDAAGMVANAGVGGETVQNDFDGVYPWAGRRRCNGYRGSDGEFVVTAYEGEAGYSQTDPDKLVYVETPLFYYFDGVKDGYEQKLISMQPQPGFLPSPACVKPDGTLRSHSYSAAYLMALEDGKATSRAGAFSAYGASGDLYAGARTLGGQYTLMRTADHYVDTLLMTVEFATKNLQSVMAGATDLPTVDTHTALAAETGANRIAVTTAQAALYVVGQTVSLSNSSLWNEEVAANRRVTQIVEKDAAGSYIYFDGEPVDIAATTRIFSRAWINGAADGVAATSGSPGDNQSGKYPCVYRGKENPYGNGGQVLGDLLARAEAEGQAKSAYFLPDAREFTGSINQHYVKLAVPFPAAGGYIKRFTQDERYPWVKIPLETGAGAATYYADQFSTASNAGTQICSIQTGALWYSGAINGPYSMRTSDPLTYGPMHKRARLG